MLPTICPYYLKAITPEELSSEHVIPDALGGPSKFSVNAYKKPNNEYGLGLDARFINDDLMRAAAAHYKIKTRSGNAHVSIQGILTYKKNNISAAIEHLWGGVLKIHPRVPVVVEHLGDGFLKIHPRIPVVVIDNGYEIIADHQNFEKLLKTTLKNNAAKGISLQTVNVHSPHGSFLGRISHSTLTKTLGLVKIGYLALAYTFGDKFLNSKAGISFRKGLDSQNETDLNQSGLDNRRILFSSLEPTRSACHLIAAVCLDDFYGVYVSLFSEKVFTRQFSFPIGEQDLCTAEGLVYKVNAKAKTLNIEVFDPTLHI